MKILVTGGAGYIGSCLVPVLLMAGHEVTVLDNFMHRQTPFNSLCLHPGFFVVRGDARDRATLRPLLEASDVLIPLAALVGAPACRDDPTAAESTNFGAIITALSLMSPQQLVIIPTTNSGYGIGTPGVECTEETPLEPISLYGRTKVDAERIVLDRGNAISLRLATVFGMSARMRLDLMVNDFVYRAVNDRAVTLFEAHFKRNFVHVRDVSRAFLFALENCPTMKDEAFNVGLSNANLSKLELCARIKKHVPAFVYLEAPIGVDEDKRDYIVSNAKIEKAGFLPMHSLDVGIAELIRGSKMLRNAVYNNA